MTTPLDASALRWSCPLEPLDFETTESVAAEQGIVGQERAKRALAFGLSIRSKSHNVFVRGDEGTGRLTLVKRLLERPGRLDETARDHVLVLDFDKLDRPALLSLPAGAGPKFSRAMEAFCKWARDELVEDVEEAVRLAQRPVQKALRAAIKDLTDPFEAHLESIGLSLAQVVDEDGDRETLLVPSVEGQAVSFEQYAAGGASEEEVAEKVQAAEENEEALATLQRAMQKLERDQQRTIEEQVHEAAREALTEAMKALHSRYPEAEAFLGQVLEHVVDHLGALKSDPEALTSLYAVNILASRVEGAPRPVIFESAPSVQTLLGTIDVPTDDDVAPHMGIRMGSLFQADGGYLVLNAHSILREDGAWDALTRSLRTRHIHLLPGDQPTTLRPPGVKPQPVPIDVKVVLIGEDVAWHLLEQNDPDFGNLFKVLADFEPVIPIDERAIDHYAKVVRGTTKKSGLAPFHREAVARLVEYGARIAAQGGYLSTRFGRIADVAREAAWLADGDVVRRADVEGALAAARERADGPGTLFRQRVADGTLRVATEGVAIGELNGLAVIAAGPEAHGMPMRITATAGPGREGPINVEHEALLSGQIHVKSFHILRGLLRRFVGATFPVTLDASIAFEQSYGGIDGDSASVASFCVLLSAIMGLPIRQDLAITGAVDQVGSVLPIGAVNEKIEGFFDVCEPRGLTGTQGVVIPVANAADLMLRPDVVAAAARGEFAIYPVERVEEAITLFFEKPADDVMHEVRIQLERFWTVVSESQTRTGAST